MPIQLANLEKSMNSMDKEIKIAGSMVYEDIGTGELVLDFYTSTLNCNTNKIEYPQQPLQQSVHVNYPILAYKCMNPDNRTIAIVHLA